MSGSDVEGSELFDQSRGSDATAGQIGPRTASRSLGSDPNCFNADLQRQDKRLQGIGTGRMGGMIHQKERPYQNLQVNRIGPNGSESSFRRASCLVAFKIASSLAKCEEQLSRGLNGECPWDRLSSRSLCVHEYQCSRAAEGDIVDGTSYVSEARITVCLSPTKYGRLCGRYVSFYFKVSY